MKFNFFIAFIFAVFPVILLISSCAFLYGSCTKGSWVYVADTPYAGGYGECVVGDGRYVYILEEYTVNYPPRFWRYDPVSNTLVNLNISLPYGTFRNGVAMAYDYSGNIYVLTGSRYKDGEERVIFYKYNISMGIWYRLADTPHVQGAGDAITYCAYDHKIYAFLGRAVYTGNYTPTEKSVFARYDPSTDSWEILSFPPWGGTDDGASLVWAGGRYIYALQGEYYETIPLRNFARYDILTDTWQEMADIPAEDGVGDGGSLLWIGYYDQSYSNVIFALDGSGVRETPGYNFSAYYINNDTWVKLPDLPYPVGYYVGNRLAYADGKIFYWQGSNSSWPGHGKKICYWLPPVEEISKIEISLSIIIVNNCMLIFMLRKFFC